MSRYNSDCKVYVGDLGNNATKQDLEDAFSHYGPLKNVWVARNPPGFAFVEFEDARDAEDAIKGLDGRTLCGRRARVELSNGKRSRERGAGGGERGGGPPRRGGRGFNEDRCYDCGERGHFARNCSRQKGGSRRRRSHSRSRSRSRQRARRSYSRSSSRSRSRSRSRNGKSLSKSRSPSKNRTPRRSRSATPRSRS